MIFGHSLESIFDVFGLLLTQVVESIEDCLDLTPQPSFILQVCSHWLSIKISTLIIEFRFSNKHF